MQKFVILYSPCLGRELVLNIVTEEFVVGVEDLIGRRIRDLLMSLIDDEAIEVDGMEGVDNDSSDQISEDKPSN